MTTVSCLRSESDCCKFGTLGPEYRIFGTLGAVTFAARPAPGSRGGAELAGTAPPRRLGREIPGKFFANGPPREDTAELAFSATVATLSR